jgi:DNA-directed RNA polymerase specialized sigma24 family protein
MCIEILYMHHDEWVRIIRKFGERNYAEDIVQETYIKIQVSGACNKAVINNEVNRAFVWIALRNNYISYYKERLKAEKVGIEHLMNLEASEGMEARHVANDKLDVMIRSEIATWEWYDRKLFFVYLEDFNSLRKMSKKTGIGLSSLSNTVKGCKDRIKEQCGEDYTDYKNRDYDLL